MNRRAFLSRTITVGSGFAVAGLSGCASRPVTKPSAAESALIKEGVAEALRKSLYPALLERAYPGHFMVTADGGYGVENTWPGLDSWQMAGAYLLVGKRRAMLDYFDFVQGSQRADGNIPFAIFPGEQSPGSTDSWLRGLRFPEDVYRYKPARREGQPPLANMSERKWIGLFTHWQMKANPLSVLGATCFILTGAEIFSVTGDLEWLREKINSLDAAGNYLVSRLSANGLLAGAGFYIESPPRNQWDGVTQCYGVFAFRSLADLHRALGQKIEAREWKQRADRLAAAFQKVFWREDHFAEYVHPEHGLVDAHGLSDVNWAAIGLGIANEHQCRILWPKLTADPAFWQGGMPTQLVTKPRTYAKWEYAEPLPFAYTDYTHDVAAMGRVWHLEALACVRMGDHKRLRESVMKVCEMGKRNGWNWFERYHAADDGTAKPAGHGWYCEYPAILVRVTLKNPGVFPEAAGFLAQAPNRSAK